MHEHTQQELLELLARDAVNWEQAAEDMDFIQPLLAEECQRRSAGARASCYRQYAARDRAAVNRVKQELLEKEKIATLH